jgi:HTH-type transcriptional repressor of NAD biosynthesis genes
MAGSKKRIGAFVGKFLPPHKGHLDQIEISAEDCDELYVVLADNKHNTKRLCDMANIPYIDAKLRLKWLKEHFAGRKNIHVIYMDEAKKNLGPHPLNQEAWSKEFKRITKNIINVKYADETYRSLNEKYFPECEFVAFERQEGISGTIIRQSPKKYINLIIEEGRYFFEDMPK